MDDLFDLQHSDGDDNHAISSVYLSGRIKCHMLDIKKAVTSGRGKQKNVCVRVFVQQPEVGTIYCLNAL